jgi:hypothetical protein
MSDLRIDAIRNDLNEIRAAMRYAIAVFQARRDSDLAQFGVGGSGTMMTQATVAQIAYNVRQSEVAVVNWRIARIDVWLGILGKEKMGEKQLGTIELFIDGWRGAEVNLERLSYHGCPNLDPPLIDGDVDPPDIDGTLNVQPPQTFNPASGPIPPPSTSEG